MMSDYVEIQGTLPDDVEDGLAESLSFFPVLGVQIMPKGDGWIDVGVWVKATDDPVVTQVRRILSEFGADAVRIREYPTEDWSAEWRNGLSAFKVGRRWWIDPHPEQATAAPDDRCRLAVEPRAAFGSGTHESTQLALMELEDQNCLMIKVLDIGTGSGVLAVAADRLDAASVVALDTDPIAAWEARGTALNQPWDCRLLVVAGGVHCLGDAGFDLVLCNMIFTEFGPLLDHIRRLLSSTGTVVLSGILESEQNAVEDLLEGSGLAVTGSRELRGWITLRAVRSDPTS